MDAYDVIVLGAGGVGSAAMFHLARRGARVLGIDFQRPPHSLGSSHGHTRVIRQAYFEHPDYVPLLRESYRLWHELEASTRRRLFYQIGLVEIGPADGVVVPGVLRAAAAHQLAVEPLAAKEVERRWPGLRADDSLTGVYEPTAGYLLVEKCVEAHLEAAAAAGAELQVDTEIQEWRNEGNSLRVRTNRGEYVASALVIAAGAWAARLWTGHSSDQSEPVGPTIQLTVRRNPMYWFRAEPAEYEAASGMPVFLFELPQRIFYGFPKLDERGVKVAEHTGGSVVEHPQWVDRSPNAEEQSRLMQFLSRHLPGVSKEVTAHEVCLYTMSPDEHFIVDRHPAHSNVVFAAGLSGHGFKFTPVLGQALADLVLDGGTDLPIEFLSLARFH
jgi:monomeric sarcosine oxidase